MGEVLPGTPPSERSPGDRLDSWKAIAAYLNRDVTTVQRWEKREGMPVRRHLHDRIGSVYAFRADLDAWARGRNSRGAQEIEKNGPLAELPTVAPEAGAAAARSRWRLALAIAAIGLVPIFGTSLWLRNTEYFWRNPIANARIQIVTNFDGTEQAAALSRDGQFLAFLSNREGPMDVWVTQLGSGQFHNLTNGRAADLANPLLRTPGFSPDGSFVTFWVRKQHGSTGSDIGVWAVPTLGGQPRPYLEGIAEFDWSHDGSRLVYHTPGPGDPMFLSDSSRRSPGQLIFTAPAGLHAHFPLWASDASFIYYVQGTLPDKMDVWRIPSKGGTPERITSHNARVSHPILLNKRNLLYLASDPDGSGPWLYSMDLERRTPHRLTSGPDPYTSLSASADGRRLAVTTASPKRTLWRMRLPGSPAEAPRPAAISLTTGTAFSPRLGPNFLLYVSVTGAGESLWKLAGGASTELWAGEGAHMSGGPAISVDGRNVAFAVRQHGQSLLYVMRADGGNARIVSDSLDVQGSPAWPPDGRSVTVAVNDHAVPRLFRVRLDGHSSAVFVREYSLDPAWSPDGSFVIYSGPDIGTTFSLKAVNADAGSYPLPPLTLTRGARHVAFRAGRPILLFLRGDIRHKNLWMIDLQTRIETQLTDINPDFDIQDFDVSRDGHEVVLERMQERSDIVLMDLPRQ